MKEQAHKSNSFRNHIIDEPVLVALSVSDSLNSDSVVYESDYSSCAVLYVH